METNVGRTILLFITAFCMSLLFSACQSKKSIEEAYQHIYLSKYAIEFPKNKDMLANCINQQIQPCLKLYENAKKGKQLLLSKNSEQALQLTLNTIFTSCRSEKDHQDQICKGAIISLYFFDKPEEDKVILDQLKTAHGSVLSKLLGPSQYAWYSNRPDPASWISHLESLPPDAFPRNGNQVIIEFFRHPLSEYENIGITLL